MALLYDIDINSSYTIKLYASSILGAGYSKAKVLAILDYSSAMQLQDVQAIHAQVLPVLPSGTPADPSKLLYVKIRTSSNAIVVLALNWISAQPVLDGATEVTLTISNISTADIPRISAALHANGFNSFAFVS